MMMNADIITKAAQVINRARAKKLRLASVESCTGGLVVAALTGVAGSSDVVEGGFITYANRAKTDFVDVAQDLLDLHGAVSAEVAMAMAEGGLRRSSADRAIAITGIAGPGGGSAEKPIGLVHFAIAGHSHPTQSRFAQFGNLGREKVRHAAVNFALDFLLDDLD